MSSGLARLTAVAAALVALLFMVGASAQSLALKAADPQPEDGALRPVLAVNYYYVRFDHVSELIALAKRRPGLKGTPLPHLNYAAGEGEVLTSKRSSDVGAIITGFIKLLEPGRYVFTIQSNDGVRMELADQLLHEDPGVHSDRFSDPIPVEVAQPGWFKLWTFYFEKKSTSTLELHWKKPGDTAFSIVPPEFFAHSATLTQ